MKKLSIFLLGALGMMAATSCEEKIDPAIPQSNPQEPILTTGDVTSQATGALASTSVLALEDYTGGASVPVMQLVETSNLPDGAVVSYKLQISDTQNFLPNSTATLDATESSEGVFSVSAQEWNDAHVYLFGKNPKVRAVYYRVPVYVTVDGSDYRLQSADYYAAEGLIEVAAMYPGFTVSDAYYFLSDATSWIAGDDAFKFEHSDTDVYDDPVFTFKFKVTDDMLVDANTGATKEIYWQIASLEGVNYGPEVDGDDNLAGVLVDENAQKGKLLDAGQYKVTINIEEMTYEIELVTRPEYLYTPGGFNGWSQTASAFLQYDTKNVPTKGYYGLVGVDNQGFKVCAAPEWNNATDYGAETDTPALEGNFLLGQDGANIMVPTPGFFWMSVQYDEASGALTTYKLEEITSVGIIGSFAASGWGSDVEMTTEDGGVTWTAEVSLAAGNEWKIRFNNAWTYSLGGEPGNPSHAVLDGDNYSVTESGDYIITLVTQPGIPVITATLK